MRCAEEGLKDTKSKYHNKTTGKINWTYLAKALPGRSYSTVWRRYKDVLAPKNKTDFTKDERKKIRELHSRLGNMW